MRAGGLLGRRAGRRAALGRARLGLPARPRGPDRAATRSRCTSTTGCGRFAAGRRVLRRALRALDVEFDGEAAAFDGQPAGVGARTALHAAASWRALGATIATGHTATDQVETVLYRLAASPGRRALLGMRAREGGVVRPLLGVTREETAAYCAERGLPWREDPSNASPRVRAQPRPRTGCSPALRGLHPAAEANVLRTLALLRDEAAVLDAVVDAALTDDRRRCAGARAPRARLADARRAPRGRRRARRGSSAPAPGARPRRRPARGGEYGRLRFERPPAPGPAPARACRAAPRSPAASSPARRATCDRRRHARRSTRSPAPLEVRAWRRATACARSASAAAARCRTSSPTARSRARAARARGRLAGEIAWIPGVATGGFRVAREHRLRLAWLPTGQRPPR